MMLQQDAKALVVDRKRSIIERRSAEISAAREANQAHGSPLGDWLAAENEAIVRHFTGRLDAMFSLHEVCTWVFVLQGSPVG